MEEKRIKVPNVSYQHCAMTINRELSKLQGVGEINVDVNSKMLTVHWDAPVTWDDIQKKLVEIGYPPG
jgi:copper chaperone CopZ